MTSITLSTLRCPDHVPPEQRRSTGTEITIGRGQNCSWILEDPERVLSKQHCVVEFYSGGWQVRDLSTNGLFVNRQGPLGRDRARPLFNGDRLQLGPYEIEVQIAEEAREPERRAPAELDAPFESPFLGRTGPLIPADFEAEDLGAAVPDHSPSASDRMAVPRVIETIGDDVDLSLRPAPAAPAERPRPDLPPPPVGPASDPDRSAAPFPSNAHADAPRSDPESLDQLLAGAGIPRHLADRLAADPENAMRQAGAVLRAAVAGIRALLMARSDIRGEFRIAQTVLRVGGNNPLKFARSDEQALADLLDPESAGALGMEEAVNDLKRHEIAMLAAMQAAAKSLLDELDPAALEAGDPGGGLLPGAREKRLWDAYRQRHADLLARFGDNFDSAFGRAFARAYEVAVSRTVD